MKYVLMFATAPDGGVEALSAPERDAIMSDIMRWFEEHRSTGRIVAGERLEPVDTATTVRRAGDRPLVVDGPFTEAKEYISGYAVVEADHLDDVIAMAEAWPALRAGEAVEIRPLVQR